MPRKKRPTPYTREERQAAGRKGGYARASSLTPEERSALAKKASEAAAEANRKRREGVERMRAVLREQGWTDEQIEAEYGIKKPARSSKWRSTPRPTTEELDEYLALVDKEFPEGLTYEQRAREATLRLRADRARAIEEGLR